MVSAGTQFNNLNILVYLEVICLNTKLFNKDFICTPDWSVEDLNTMLDLAFRLKSEFGTGIYHDQILRAKTLYMLFFEESTRTRNSFETGMTQLGGHAVYLTPMRPKSTTAKTPKTPARY